MYADLTIMEEGSEFIEHIKEGKEGPMFTSCCPGWVRFLKLEYPELVGRLSTAKSPQQMFGAVAKSYYAKLLGVEPDEIFCVSIMPCTAKKYECDVAAKRGERLYALDRGCGLRFSHENPAVQELYRSYLEAPLSHRAHELLHTDQEKWEM